MLASKTLLKAGGVSLLAELRSIKESFSCVSYQTKVFLHLHGAKNPTNAHKRGIENQAPHVFLREILSHIVNLLFQREVKRKRHHLTQSTTALTRRKSALGCHTPEQSSLPLACFCPLQLRATPLSVYLLPNKYLSVLLGLIIIIINQCALIK